MKCIDWKKVSIASAAFFALALALISTTPVQAADYDVGSIHITAPWARATSLDLPAFARAIIRTRQSLLRRKFFNDGC